MRPGPGLAQGNLLAIQLTSTVEFSLNFVVDLINLGRFQKVVTSSDVLKKEMSRLDQTEWTSGTS